MNDPLVELLSCVTKVQCGQAEQRRRTRQDKRVVEVFRAGRMLDLPEWQTHTAEALRVTRMVLHKDVANGRR